MSPCFFLMRVRVTRDGAPADCLPGFFIARSASAVQVSCFKAGRQADWLTARLAGAPADQEVAGDYPDYAPGLVRRTAG